MTLPARKDDFPQFLYLDQNKWIDLARAHYDRDGGADFKEALAAVRRAVAAHRLVVPMSGVHVMETMAPADADRRRRLAEFMVDLSGNNAVLPHMSMRGLEILQAVLRKAELRPTTSIRTAIVRPGLSYALGAEATVTAPDGLRQELLALVNAPATSVRMLVEAADRAFVGAARAEDEAAASVLEETRRRAVQAMDDDMRHRVELVDLFRHGEPKAELSNALRALGIPASDFAARFASPDDWIAFFHDIPTVDVFVTLGLARDKEASRKIHRNDLKDMAFLSVAVPYANVIVAERFWSGVVERTGLAGRYQTIIHTDARSLPEVLAKQGCI